MVIDPLTGLPAALTGGAVGAVVSGLLSLFAPLILMVPGFRANDASRNVLMKVLVFALTLGGMLALAWCLGIVIPRVLWPELALYAASGTTLAHLVYKGARGVQSSGVSAPVVLQTSQASLPPPVIVPDAPTSLAPTAPASQSPA